MLRRVKKYMAIGFSVCIPAYNEASNLEGLFCSLLESDLDRFVYEILLCDSGSCDGTKELCNRWSKVLNVRLVVTASANASQNLNAGLIEAANTIFCRIDARARPAKNYFTVAYHLLEAKSDQHCAIGPSVHVEPSRPGMVPSIIAKLFMSPFLMGPSKWKRSFFFRGFEGEVDTIYLGFFYVDDLRSIGGFNDTLVRKQDIDLLKRLKHVTQKKILCSCNLRARYVLRHDTLSEISNRAYVQGKYAGLYTTPVRPAHAMPVICLLIYVATDPHS